MLQLLSNSYSKLVMRDHQNAASTSAIAEQANFWDPPSKHEPSVSSNDNVNGLLR